MEITFTGVDNQLSVPYNMLIGGTMVVFETLLLASEANSQGPTLLDTVHQILYGPAVNSASDPVSLAADGTFTFHEGGSYVINLSSTFGRVGSAGVSEVFFRLLFDGTQVGASDHIQVGDADTLAPRSVQFAIDAPAGLTMTAEMIRDASGNNSGDLIAGIPSPAGWTNPVSTAAVIGRWTVPL